MFLIFSKAVAFTLLLGCLVLPVKAAPTALLDEPSRQIDGEDGQPAIWLLSDDDTRIWLFGTNHVLPYGFAWRSPDLERIIREADELVLETADDETSLKPTTIFSMMSLETPVSIFDRLSPEYHQRLRYISKNSQIPIAQLDSMETWAIGFVLIGLSMGDLFGDEGAGEGGMLTGVEDQLTEIFEGQEKPISGVETSIGQLNFFRNMSEDGQRGFLESLIAEAAEAGESDQPTEDEILASWIAGNVEAMDAECDDEDNFPPEIHDVLLRQRNENWTGWLVERMEEPGDVLFAVGACHLAGRVSLQHMLAERGFSAERIH